MTVHIRHMARVGGRIPRWRQHTAAILSPQCICNLVSYRFRRNGWM